MREEETYFKEIMSNGKLEMPFTDFEDNVMMHIEKTTDKPVLAKEIRLSWIFFVLGSVFGIIISYILPRMKGPILGTDPQKLAVFFQIGFVVLLFTQLETLLKIKNGRQK